jgi:tRNA (Thr-GGU) A37 N-methylase
LLRDYLVIGCCHSSHGLTSAGIEFAGVDLIDRTPVIDIKPYVSRFDRAPGQPRCGWFDQVSNTEGVTPAQLAAPGGADGR